MNLDDVVAQLLAGSLDEVTSARNAKAKELKAAGERDLAAEVAGLKKPPVAVWAVNQLARQNKPVLERLRRAGAGVVQAQPGAVSGRKNAAPELRSASEALQRELEAAVNEAGAVRRADEHARGGASRRRRPRPRRRRRSRPPRPHTGCGKKPTGSRPMQSGLGKGRNRPRKTWSAPMPRRRCREKRRDESGRAAKGPRAVRRQAWFDGPAGWL